MTDQLTRREFELYREMTKETINAISENVAKMTSIVSELSCEVEKSLMARDDYKKDQKRTYDRIEHIERNIEILMDERKKVMGIKSFLWAGLTVIAAIATTAAVMWDISSKITAPNKEKNILKKPNSKNLGS